MPSLGAVSAGNQAEQVGASDGWRGVNFSLLMDSVGLGCRAADGLGRSLLFILLFCILIDHSSIVHLYVLNDLFNL